MYGAAVVLPMICSYASFSITMMKTWLNAGICPADGGVADGRGEGVGGSWSTTIGKYPAVVGVTALACDDVLMRSLLASALDLAPPEFSSARSTIHARKEAT